MTQELVERALEVSQKRRHLLEALRQALLSEDKEKVFALARRLTGLNDEESIRTGQSIN